MPRIIIDCPTTGAEVPTGHRTQDFALSAIVEPRSFRCPVCHEVHAWRGEDARVEGADRNSGALDGAMEAAGPN
ncbi:MAG TPA: hypothetical protein VNW53_04530 [Phenylobacterium sp.]|jgi:hypothetical protein|uniref:hypothetical protein n=1 Tax=Phenylobacterium sp. TaxID=1871053 RepID=UPI002C625363|nr:hypothetical protein [Phenylobacterium sp.]HXA38244.1 hypothetical protein [Phenylobacterium sp.]